MMNLCNPWMINKLNQIKSFVPNKLKWIEDEFIHLKLM